MIQMQPLNGRRIVLTRDAEGSSRLAQRLEALGAEILTLPLIEVRPELDREAAREVFEAFASYEWILFTSRNGVRHFFPPFLEQFSDIRSLGFIRIGAVGAGTLEALAAYHLRADFVPPRATARDLGTGLCDHQSLDSVKVLVITGNRNREDLVQLLWENRAIVDTLQVYATGFPDLSEHAGAARFRSEGADALVFASASAVQAFGEQSRHLSLKPDARIPALCSFGPTTSSRMKEAGIPVAVEADNPGLEGMVEALVRHFTQ